MGVFDLTVALAGLGVGFIVGLTGMGGGALMTPILVLVFGIQPLAAVSSDVVASMIMKPVGGAVHWRRGTVHKPLVLWLMLGSIPSAFLGVLLLKSLGGPDVLQSIVKHALGIALLVVVAGLLARPLLQRRRLKSYTSSELSEPVSLAPPAAYSRCPITATACAARGVGDERSRRQRLRSGS